MFDIGFSEILLVAVVALLVVGPRELPTMLRTLSEWTRKTRRVINNVRAEIGEIERELLKAEEVKRLMAKEVDIVARHQVVDEGKRTAPVDTSAQQSAGAGESSTLVGNEVKAEGAGEQRHGAAKS